MCKVHHPAIRKKEMRGGEREGRERGGKREKEGEREGERGS